MAGLTQSLCFPLKSHSAVVLQGAMQVNISISIESVLFWRSSVFLGSSALTQLRLGSSTCVPNPNPSTMPPLLHIPYTGEYKQNLLTFLLPGMDLSSVKDPAPEKTKQRSRSLLCLEAACGCVFVFASLHMLQANKQDTGKHKPTGKPATKVKLCGKNMTDVYSLAHS